MILQILHGLGHGHVLVVSAVLDVVVHVRRSIPILPVRKLDIEWMEGSGLCCLEHSSSFLATQV